MLRSALVALACLCAACATPANSYYEPYKRTAPNNIAGQYAHKSLHLVLQSIDERLGTLEALTSEQKQQSKRLDEIKSKIALLESTMLFRLEQAELSKTRLEHRLQMLQSNMQDALESASDRMERSQARIAAAALNLTHSLEANKNLAEKVNNVYRDSWRRSLVLEQLARDGLALVNVTRRELADGVKSLARRQREYRLTMHDVETAVTAAERNITRELTAHSTQVDNKLAAVLTAQEQFLDTCHRIQRDPPQLDTPVADLLDKLLDNVINKTAITFHRLQVIQKEVQTHDLRMRKALTSTHCLPTEDILKKIEQVLRNSSVATLRETELQKLTEKYIDLTNRADAALQRLELRLNDPQEAADVDIKSDADHLMHKLKNINSEDNEDEYDYDDSLNQEDDGLREWESDIEPWKLTTTTRSPHRRHLHKHPYDRGPKRP